MTMIHMNYNRFRCRCYKIGLILFLCIGALWISPVNGYVLKGPHVIDLVVQKLAGAKTLQVNQTITVNDPLIANEPIGLQETLRFVFPDRFRSDIVHEDTHRIHVFARGKSLTVVDGAIVADHKGRFGRYKDLFLYNSRKSLHKALSSYGVDVGITSLGRQEDSIVFVIGANYPDDSASQLWVDKEQFVPLRWINILSSDNTPGGEPERLEFIYRDWRKLDGVWYPMLIETFHNKTPIRRIRVKKVKANEVVAEELLSIPHLMTQYKQKEKSIPDNDTQNLDMDEVQRTLEEFRKKFDP